MIIDVFLRYLTGHLVGDFLLQPYWLALAKRKGWKGLLIHVTVVTVATAIIIAGTLPRWGLWMVALFSIHLFIDQFRTFWFTDNSKGRSLLLLIADQFVHVISLILLSRWATGEPARTLWQIFSQPLGAENLRLVLAGIVILAVWVTPILEIEVIVALASFGSKSGSGVAPIGLSDRLMGGAERILALALAVGGWWWLAPVVFIPRAAWLKKHGGGGTFLPKITTSALSTLLMALLLLRLV